VALDVLSTSDDEDNDFDRLSKSLSNSTGSERGSRDIALEMVDVKR